jgi:signal transduction histidine kinase
VKDTIGVRAADLYLSDGSQGEYRPAGKGNGRPLAADSALVAWLARERQPLIAAPNFPDPKLHELRSTGVALAFPLLSGDRLLGIMTLGEKRSGEPYTQEELETLATLAHSTTLALENARLHEERLAILRQQLARVTQAQEEERQRIARELHDGVGPTLASMHLRLRATRKLLDRDQEAAADVLDELAELSQDNVRDIRRLIYDLRPAALDELGLVPALREYLNRCQREHDLRIGFSASEEERLPPLVETALFRIVQEAVNNVVKHAGARRVEVTLDRTNGLAALGVTDDGRGFDADEPRSGQHLGLWSMRERVEQLGGRFELQSRPGRGTVLKAWLPVDTEED